MTSIANKSSSQVRLFLSKIDTVSEKQIHSTKFGFGLDGWVSVHSPKVYVTNPFASNESDIIVLDTNSNTVVKRIRFGGLVTATALTPDGKYLYVTYSNQVATINTATDKLIGSPSQVGQGAYAIAIAPDGLRAYVANYFDNTVSVIDISPQ